MKAKKIKKADPVSAPSWYRKKQKSDLQKEKHQQQVREKDFMQMLRQEIAIVDAIIGGR